MVIIHTVHGVLSVHRYRDFHESIFVVIRLILLGRNRGSASAASEVYKGQIRISLGVAEECIQRKAIVYDGDGDAHYDTISAFIKSMRGSDPDATLYWLAKMIHAGEDPRFIARRIMIYAADDV